MPVRQFFFLATLTAKTHIPDVRRRNVIVLLVVLTCVGISCYFLLPQSQANYNGKSLNQWLTAYENTTGAAQDNAADAVRQIGTNALPLLMRKLRAKDSETISLLVKIAGQSALNGLGVLTAAQHRSQALTGLFLLGDAAAPAMPKMIKLLNTND